MNATKSTLALAVLAFSLTHTAQAADTPADHSDTQNTYWGVGIGSVLGAVIAGPPGAAIGATLGGSIGWGQDQNEALDHSVTEREQQTLKLKQTAQVLEKHKQTLRQSHQELQDLKRANAQQADRLERLETSRNTQADDTEFLNKLAGHYAQDIYFQSGQFETPEYAKDRLANLIDLLKHYPNLQVTLKGYTDPTGTPKLNEKLAQARVDSIKAALSAQGIDEARVTGVAIGEVNHAVQVDQLDLENLASSEALLTSAPINPAKPHVLDRRVSIELSLPHAHGTDEHLTVADEEQAKEIGDLAVLEP